MYNITIFFSTVLYQSNFNIFNYKDINEVHICFLSLSLHSNHSLFHYIFLCPVLQLSTPNKIKNVYYNSQRFY